MLFLAAMPAGAAGKGTILRSLPHAWSYNGDTEQTLPSLDTWWSDFNDPALDSLIAMGESNNFDVAIAARRVEQARQAVRSARSGYYPTVSAVAGWQRSRSGGAIAGGYNLGVQASWEPDIFGKVAAKVKQSGHSYNATKAEYTGAMVSVCAQIASAYFDLRMAQQQQAVATEHIAGQQNVVDITNARHEAGLASALDVAQARTVLLATQASLPLLDTQIRNDINTIATLCGVYAADIEPIITPGNGTMPECNRIVATGVPAQLLRRRPDIVEAEELVRASADALGIARKDYLPTLAITGTLGTAAERPGDLFTGNSVTWSVAPTLSWTVFDGMARRAGVVSAREAMEEQVANYNATVHQAVQEVENAITTYSNDLKRIATLNEVVQQSSLALRLSVNQYKQGLSSFTNVVDAQMNYLEYTNSLVSARGDALVSLATLYRAMGGGVNM